jgi:ABC-type microcin C transport system permease subunit YejE
LWPHTCNNYFEANLTKVGFSNGGHYSATTIKLSHSRKALVWSRLPTFWSFHLCTSMASPKMWAFILAWSWCWGLPS